MKGWTFCIVTIPGNEKIVLESIQKIQSEFIGINNCEVIVVGGRSIDASNFKIRIKFIPFTESIFSPKFGNLKAAFKGKSFGRLFYRTGAICHKKNLAARLATFDKLCIMHDYVGLESGWREGFESFGDNWGIAMNIVLNKDGIRHRDWLSWDHPAITNKSDGSGACLIPYEKYTKYMYISGAYFCIKKDFFLMNPLNEKLFWGDAEDVEWSLRVREKVRFTMNSGSSVRCLRQKSINEAPYCENWKRNEISIRAVISENDEF